MEVTSIRISADQRKWRQIRISAVPFRGRSDRVSDRGDITSGWSTESSLETRCRLIKLDLSGMLTCGCVLRLTWVWHARVYGGKYQMKAVAFSLPAELGVWPGRCDQVGVHLQHLGQTAADDPNRGRRSSGYWRRRGEALSSAFTLIHAAVCSVKAGLHVRRKHKPRVNRDDVSARKRIALVLASCV